LLKLFVRLIVSSCFLNIKIRKKILFYKFGSNLNKETAALKIK
jgi:hypothetical protein